MEAMRNARCFAGLENIASDVTAGLNGLAARGYDRGILKLQPESKTSETLKS